MFGAEKWLVFGGSWGAMLAQHGVSEIFPDLWERFIDPIPVDQRYDIFGAYRRLLLGSETPDQARAAFSRRRRLGGPRVEPRIAAALEITCLVESLRR